MISLRDDCKNCGSPYTPGVGCPEHGFRVSECEICGKEIYPGDDPGPDACSAEHFNESRDLNEPEWNQSELFE